MDQSKTSIKQESSGQEPSDLFLTVLLHSILGDRVMSAPKSTSETENTQNRTTRNGESFSENNAKMQSLLDERNELQKRLIEQIERNKKLEDLSIEMDEEARKYSAFVTTSFIRMKRETVEHCQKMAEFMKAKIEHEADKRNN